MLIVAVVAALVFSNYDDFKIRIKAKIEENSASIKKLKRETTERFARFYAFFLM